MCCIVNFKYVLEGKREQAKNECRVTDDCCIRRESMLDLVVSVGLGSTFEISDHSSCSYSAVAAFYLVSGREDKIDL